MQTSGLRATLAITRVYTSATAPRREDCGVFQISSDDEPLIVGRKHETFRTEKSISRAHIRLHLLGDGTVEATKMGQAPISLRDAENGPLQSLLKDIPVIMYKRERLILYTSDSREYEVTYVELKTKNKEDATEPSFKLRRMGSSKPKTLSRSFSRDRLVLDDIDDDRMDVDTTITPAAAPMPVVEPARPTITIDLGVHIDNGTSGSVKRRRLIFDDSSAEDDISAAFTQLSQPPSPPPQVPTLERGPVSQLLEMFPDRTRDALAAVLAVKGSVENATDFLLSYSHLPNGALLSLTSPSSVSTASSPVSRAAFFPKYPPPSFTKAEVRTLAPPPPSRFGGNNGLTLKISQSQLFEEPIPPPEAFLSDDSDEQMYEEVDDQLVEPTPARSSRTTQHTVFKVVKAPSRSNSSDGASSDHRKRWEALRSSSTSLPPELNEFVESLMAEVSKLKNEVSKKETELNQVTGGFSFEVWSRIQREKLSASGSTQTATTSAPVEEECAVCFEAHSLVSASCGCKVLCAACLPMLVSRKDGCPKCLKLLMAKPSSNQAPRLKVARARSPTPPSPDSVIWQKPPAKVVAQGPSPTLPFSVPQSVLYPVRKSPAKVVAARVPLPDPPATHAPRAPQVVSPYNTRSRDGAVLRDPALFPKSSRK